MPGKVPNKNSGVQDSLLYYESQRPRRKNCCLSCCLITLIFILVLLVVAFLLVFVGYPFLFKHTIDLQRSLVFPTDDLLPKHSEYGNFKKYNLSGSRLLYLPVDDERNIVLGVWHVLPEPLVNESESESFNYDRTLSDLDYPIVLHFHENGGNRIHYAPLYRILRQFFHVIAFDYRGYADSSHTLPSEDEIVRDSIKIYKWVQTLSVADVYFWGHGIGAALATHTISKLHEEDIVPAGLVLEAPFTTIADQLRETSPYKIIYSWMPWYESTMLDPLEKNGFNLRTIDYLLKVDCPIMMLHAKDDRHTPFSLGVKVLKSAQNRDAATQGGVVFHQLSHKFGFGHNCIYKWSELPAMIKNHTKTCEEFQTQTNY